jgi:hypothetical protein
VSGLLFVMMNSAQSFKSSTIRNIEQGAGSELTDPYILFLDQVSCFHIFFKVQ